MQHLYFAVVLITLVLGAVALAVLWQRHHSRHVSVAAALQSDLAGTNGGRSWSAEALQDDVATSATRSPIAPALQSGFAGNNARQSSVAPALQSGFAGNNARQSSVAPALQSGFAGNNARQSSVAPALQSGFAVQNATRSPIAAALQRDMEQMSKKSWQTLHEIPLLIDASETRQLQQHGVVVGVHIWGHNPTVVVCINGTMRLINRLIFESHIKRKGDRWIGQLHGKWIADVMAQAEALMAAPIPHIDVLVSEFGPPGTPWNAKDYFPGHRVRRYVDPGFQRHALAHAESGFFASPFQSALVVAVHGAGFDGVHNMYLGTRWNRSVVALWVEPNDPDRPGKKPKYYKGYNSPCFLFGSQCTALGLGFEACSLLGYKGHANPEVVQYLHDVYSKKAKEVPPQKHPLWTSEAVCRARMRTVRVA